MRWKKVEDLGTDGVLPKGEVMVKNSFPTYLIGHLQRNRDSIRCESEEAFLSEITHYAEIEDLEVELSKTQQEPFIPPAHQIF